MSTITVNIKKISQKTPSIIQQTIDLEHTPDDVRGLITEIVKASIQAYQQRSDNEIFKILSHEEIDDAAVTGKISFGVQYPKENKKKPNIEDATAHAIQSFEDGIICIFNGERRLELLEDNINLEESFTFIKLAMLSGRLW